jgi:hypothetical protein
MNILARTVAVTLGLAFAVPGLAQQPAASTPASPAASMSSSLGVVVFPAKGQAADVQSRDEGECYTWSKGQTGIDPMAPAPAPASSTTTTATTEAQEGGGERVRGAARGAAAGAVIGEVANDDAGDGAAIGATVGVLKGGAERRRKQEQAEQQQATAQQEAAAQQQAANQQQRDQFNKGFAACLEAKGYTVK